MKLNRFISLLLISILVVMMSFFVGCSKEGNSKKIIFVMQQKENGDFFNSLNDNLEKTLTESGYSYENLCPEQWGANYQSKVIEEAIESKPEAILLAPVIGNQLYGAIEKANKANIPIILLDTNLDRELLAAARISVSTFIGIDNYKGGKMVADKVSEGLEKGSKVAIVGGGVTAFNGEERCKGFEDEIKSKGMNVVGKTTTDWSDTEGYQRGKLILTVNPDVKLVFTANSSILKGFMKAANELGITSIKGATFEKDSITDEYMKNGILLCTYDQNIKGISKTVYDVIKKIESGEKLEEVTNSEGILCTK
ncbi:MAG: sugar ABC transporter substrate-binding protein [Clostridium sp.]|nr:sugar ABC transporter substrate-binding protein [Clostridium sp.]